MYRKRHPAIGRSQYHAGKDSPVFQVDRACFGILICYDSTFPELGFSLASRGARVIFVPTNNALPESKPSSDLVLAARACDVVLATANHCSVLRADVAGMMGGLRSEGSSAIISPAGKSVSSARALIDDLLVAAINLAAV